MRKDLFPPAEDPYEFGVRLLEVLGERGVSQAELAAWLDTEPSTISKWVNGKAKPNYRYLKGMARVLEVSSDYLLGLEEEETA